jgi:hypothetical protein
MATKNTAQTAPLSPIQKMAARGFDLLQRANGVTRAELVELGKSGGAIGWKKYLTIIAAKQGFGDEAVKSSDIVEDGYIVGTRYTLAAKKKAAKVAATRTASAGRKVAAKKSAAKRTRRG